MSDERNRIMDIMMNMQRDAWSERQPIPPMPKDETTPMYDTSEIYDHPAPYSTIRGIFAYTGVEMIK